MPSQATAQTHPAPGIVAAAPWRVQALTILPGLRLSVTFRDGTTGIVDCASVRPGSDLRAVRGTGRSGLFCPGVSRLGRRHLGPNGADLILRGMYEQVRENKRVLSPFSTVVVGPEHLHADRSEEPKVMEYKCILERNCEDAKRHLADAKKNGRRRSDSSCLPSTESRS